MIYGRRIAHGMWKERSCSAYGRVCEGTATSLSSPVPLSLADAAPWVPAAVILPFGLLS